MDPCDLRQLGQFDFPFSYYCVTDKYIILIWKLQRDFPLDIFDTNQIFSAFAMRTWPRSGFWGPC